MNEEKQGMTQWGFYALCVKVGLPVGVGLALFLLARKGDVAAIAVLAVLVALGLLALGLIAAVVIMDRQAQAEQRRFVANAKENMWFLEQQARVTNLQLQAQGRQSREVQRVNEELRRLLDKPGATVDVDALVWEVRDDVEGEGRW